MDLGWGLTGATGPIPARAVLALAAVLGLSAADAGAIGALAAPLEHHFAIGNTRFGLLITVSTLVAAVASLPAGILADRVRRVRLLTFAVVLWAAATVVEACSTSYAMLLASRSVLGLLTALAGPFVVSLAGDTFPAERRAHLFGYVLTGELAGAGIGILVAGTLSGFLGWRLALGVLALPAFALALTLRRAVVEPGRQVQHAESVDHQNVRSAVRYVISVRTNLVLIVGSGLGYFFLQGLETFAELFLRDRFGVSQSEAAGLFVGVGVCAMVGALLGGRIADARERKGHGNARLVVAAAGFALTPLFLAPGLLAHQVGFALPCFFAVGFSLGSVNPPLDAARLDVVAAAVWGRAEGVRTTARTTLQAAAPLVFGALSGALGAGSGGLGAGVDTSATQASGRSGDALAGSFALLSVPLLAVAVLLVAARRRYLADREAADPGPGGQ